MTSRSERAAPSRSSSTAAATGSRFIRSTRKPLERILPKISARGRPGRPNPDRAARFTVCGAVQAALNYDITDAKGDLIIRTGANVANSNPRVDDPTNRLLGTSGRVPTCGPGESEPVCDSSVLAADPAGGFLAGNILAIPLQPHPSRRRSGTGSCIVQQDRPLSRDLHEPGALVERSHVRLRQRRRRRRRRRRHEQRSRS